MNKLGFIITAYDQKREVNFTVDMLRRKWKRTVESPISIVISGDPDRTLQFPNDPLTRVTTLDNMVGADFNNLVSTSIMKQIMHGMIELEDLERVGKGCVNQIVHMHGDILLMNEDGFFAEVDRFIKSNKDVAGDTVGPQRNDYIHFDGLEIMPQLFITARHFVADSGFLRDMIVVGDLERRSTEWALRGNLLRAWSRLNGDTYYKKEEEVFNSLFHNVKPSRGQWELHSHFGGFAHFGNSLHFSKQDREARNEAALRAYGINLESWSNAKTN